MDAGPCGTGHPKPPKSQVWEGPASVQEATGTYHNNVQIAHPRASGLLAALCLLILSTKNPQDTESVPVMCWALEMPQGVGSTQLLLSWSSQTSMGDSWYQ